jgi:hypothetical protein
MTIDNEDDLAADHIPDFFLGVMGVHVHVCRSVASSAISQ